MINDAAMQALGDYRGGRMLFLGLGTGLGSALIIDGVLAPLELAHLPYKKGRTFEAYVGLRGLKRLGRRKWEQCVWDVVERLTAALQVEEVVLGGGNAARLKALPAGTRLGDNGRAFIGGYRLWNPPTTRAWCHDSAGAMPPPGCESLYRGVDMRALAEPPRLTYCRDPSSEDRRWKVPAPRDLP